MIKNEEFLEKYSKNWEKKLALLSKTNLIVNLYIIKKI